MAGQAILGAKVLKPAKAIEAGAPGEVMEALVAEHSGMVFRIAYSILRNHHDAEDAAQECFLRALKFRNKMELVRNPKTWLARVAWTTALDRRSRRAVIARREELLEEDVVDRADPGSLPDDHLADVEMQKLLELLIAGLPEELRQPLELSTVRELNSAEIAEVMCIPEGSVRTRLLRARRQLKEKLGAMLEVKRRG